MKSIPLLLLAAGLFSFPAASANAAASDPASSNEIAALEKKLAATRDELAALRAALATAKAQTQAAETRVQALSRQDSQVTALQSRVRVLERDLQSATTALKQVAAEKAALESRLTGATPPADGAKDAAPRPAANGQTAGKTGNSIPVITVPESELLETRTRLSAAEKNLGARETELSRANQELAAAQSQLAAARELESRVRQLEAEKAARADRPADSGATREELARLNAAQVEAERKLASFQEANAALAKERDDLRAQVARGHEAETRLRQLESEKSAVKSTGDSSIGKEELDRAIAARVDAENKLATALRSFTVVTRERDELRTRVAELAARNNQEKH